MEEDLLVQAGESLDDLILGGYKLLQAEQGYRFSIDAVLLAHFPALNGVHTAVDLGTGNAPIPIILAERKKDLYIHGLELQDSMVKRARRSIILNRLEERVFVHQGDIRTIEDFLPGGCAELVLSNPPFWKAGEGKISLNPEQAVARHELKLDLTAVIRAAAYLLKQKGRFVMIHRADRLLEILEACQEAHLYPRRLRTVHPFLDRPAKLVLLEACKNLPGHLELMPPLIIYEKQGIYCQEIRNIYRS